MTSSAGDIESLLDLMRRLRDPEDGCAWDRVQTFATIAPYTIEEAYEVADAIERGDRAALVDELGDLLFQVVFHAQMADEEGTFSFADVVAAILAKMIRRHPHVFGDATIADADAQRHAWELHKAREREAAAAESGDRHRVLDGLPLALPALLRAQKIQKRLKRVGFDFADVEGALAKLSEELRELDREIHASDGKRSAAALEAELGDVLFAAVNVARFLDVDAEAALRRTNAKVERRFRAIEDALAARGLSPESASLEEMDQLWTAAKSGERP